MYRWFLAVGVVLLGFPFVSDVRAVILMFLDNPFDEGKALDAARGDKRVLAFRREMDEFSDRLGLLKERDFHTLFGKPERKKRQEYALSIAGPSGLILSGLRYADSTKKPGPR